MALDLQDVIAVQKAAGGTNSLRKATLEALVNFTSAAAGFWVRNGTDLSPATDGDNLTGVGDISAATATFTGAIEAESIDGGEYAT